MPIYGMVYESREVGIRSSLSALVGEACIERLSLVIVIKQMIKFVNKLTDTNYFHTKLATLVIKYSLKVVN